MLARCTVIRGTATLALLLGACADDGGGSIPTHTISFTSSRSPLVFAAAQVGTAWKVLTPANGIYSFEAVGETYGIAAVCGDQAFATITVLQATIDETDTLTFDCYSPTDPMATLDGTVSGPVSMEARALLVGYYELGTAESYSVMAPAGTWDVFALDRAPANGPARFVRENDVTLTDGVVTPLDFDFTSEGVPFESHAVSLAGIEAGETLDVTSRIRTKPGGTAFTMTGTPDAYRALPAAQLRAGDLQSVTAGAVAETTYRGVRRWFFAPEDLTATLPAASPPSVVDSATAKRYLRMRASLPAALDADLVELTYVQPIPEQSYMVWTARLSRGYRDAVDASTYTLPDLSMLAGFMAVWNLVPATHLQWVVDTTSSDAPMADLLESEDSMPAIDRTDTLTEQVGEYP